MLSKELLKVNKKKTKPSWKIDTKDLNRHFIKEDIQTYRWQISIWKGAPYHMSSGACKLKQLPITTHLLKWPKSWMLARMWSNRSSLSLLTGKQNGTTTLEANWAASYKTKHTLTVQPRSQLLGWLQLSKGVENVGLVTTLHMMLRAAWFIISKTWKQPGRPFSRRMD